MRMNLCVRLAMMALVSAVVLLGSAAPARAQATGAVSVDIDFPSLVILYYYSDLDVTVPASALAGVMVGGAGDTADDQGLFAATLDGTFTDDAALAAPALGADPAALGMTILNSWAVRSVGPASGNNTQVSVALTTATLTDAVNGGTIDINSVGVRLAGGGGPGAASVTFPATGLAAAQVGDLLFDLDVTGADFEGTYAGGAFTITAENL